MSNLTTPTPNTQLPAEVVADIHAKAEAIYSDLNHYAMERDQDFGLPMVNKILEPLEETFTAYATKLHQAQQDNEKMRVLLEDAATQIEYLHNKFTATGSGNNVLSRIKTILDGTK